MHLKSKLKWLIIKKYDLNELTQVKDTNRLNNNFYF